MVGVDAEALVIAKVMTLRMLIVSVVAVQLMMEAMTLVMAKTMTLIMMIVSVVVVVVQIGWR